MPCLPGLSERLSAASWKLNLLDHVRQFVVAGLVVLVHEGGLHAGGLELLEGEELALLVRDLEEPRVRELLDREVARHHRDRSVRSAPAAACVVVHVIKRSPQVYQSGVVNFFLSGSLY